MSQSDEPQYPESEKLGSEGVSTVVEFLEWLQDHGYFIAETRNGPIRISSKLPSALINEWLGVDPVKLEAERRTMLARLMGGNQ